MKSKKNKSENIKSQHLKTLAEAEINTENLGLDADHSSDANYQRFNNDNDMVTRRKRNNDSENSTLDGEGHSPLMDK